MKKDFLLCVIGILISVTCLANTARDENCGQCHKVEVQQWQSSHHALAMQLATDKTVLGNFNNVTVNYFGVTTRFFKKNIEFRIESQGDDGKNHEYKVKYTFGVDPLQQYLLEFPGGRFQAFSIAWDTRQKKWFPLNGQENITFKDPLFWTKRFYNWNRYCADCHSTQVRENYEAKTDSFHTVFAEINVGCRACHGTEKHPTQKLTQVETCAACHSRRHSVNPDHKVGSPLLDNYLPEILKENIYYANGGIQQEDFEYGSFIQSKMSKSGVLCSDCHNPHTAKLKASGNSLCAQCHSVTPPKSRFPSILSKNYDTPAHTHHPKDSLGSQCISCHMPTKTYMQIHVRHDHYFRIPRPDLTIKYKIPNACNACHTNKTAEWAQKNLEHWFGKRQFPGDYTEIIENGRAHKPMADQSLLQLARDDSQVSIVRATALYLLRDPSVSTSALTKDKDPLVRVYALNRLPASVQSIPILASLLSDPIRAVRMDAAKSLAAAPLSLLDAAQQKSFLTALAEYKNTQQALIDTPEANLNLGVLAEAQGDPKTAETYYQSALHRDPTFYPASQNLAILYNAEHRNPEATQVLQQAIVHNPGQAMLHYSLGLLLAEEHKLSEAKTAFSVANRLQANDPKTLYSLTLLCVQLSQMVEAEAYLKEYQKIDPDSPKLKELQQYIEMKKAVRNDKS